MIKRYQTNIIGDGLTMETARKPEFAGENINWTLIEDFNDYFIVDIEAADFSVLDNYPETVEVQYGNNL